MISENTPNGASPEPLSSNPFSTITQEVMEEHRGKTMAFDLDTREVLASIESSVADAREQLDALVLAKYGEGRKYAYLPGAAWPQTETNQEQVTN